MTLQQLRYLVAVAEYGSFNAAAQALFASQSNLSTSVKELERELGVTVFTRSRSGAQVTNDGTEVLAYARLVVEQADMLETRFSTKAPTQQRLAVSAQHYAFGVQAFIATIEECESDSFEFIMRECATADIIDDVAAFRSDIGILYVDRFNKRALSRSFENARLTFTPLFDATMHVFVGENHPLAQHDSIHPSELEPYPRYSFEQGVDNSLYYAEEPLGYLPHKKNIRISDRGTLTNLLISHCGYAIATGVLSHEMQTGIVSIPLDVDGTMRVGYLMHSERKASELLCRYITHLKAVVANNPSVANAAMP